jgi:DNA-binding winged helix-turn-helix (wHTH) protein/tetratricopeptide (TPR) repeat protein
MKSFPPFQLDPINQCLWRAESRITLPPKSFAVLEYLVNHASRLVTQDELLEAIWPETYVQPEVLRKYILDLRKLLGDTAKDSQFIQTYPKRGYQFVAPVTDVAAGGAQAATPGPLPNDHHREGTLRGATALPELKVWPVGREEGLAELDGRLQKVLQGQRQIIFITGEAGIGKSTLVDAFLVASSAKSDAQVVRGQCVEGFGSKEAYYPVLEALGQWMRPPDGDSIIAAMTAEAPTWMLQFPALVNSLKPEQREALQRETFGATRDRMVREICEALENLSAVRPIILILEDLHWVDHSTLDLISAIARRRGPARLLVIGTYRPVEVILSQSPLKVLKQDLQIHGLLHEVALERLNERNVGQHLANEFGQAGLTESLAHTIHRHSDGNPLFMTAIVSDFIKNGILARAGDAWVLSADAASVDPGVPDTLQQMIELQVDRLGEPDQALLNTASVAGHKFSAWAVGAMLGVPAEQAEEMCDRMAQRQQFLRPARSAAGLGGDRSSSYEFRHALYRDALYRRLSVGQRASNHLKLAKAAEQQWSAVADLASEIALHFEHGREPEKAARYLVASADNAARRYAHRDSIRSLEHARVLLCPRLTVEDRAAELSIPDQQQLELRILEKISDGHYALGEMQESITADCAAVALAERWGLKVAQANALTRQARALTFVEPDRCIQVCEQAVQVSATHDDPLLQARAEMLAACWRIVNNGWRKEDAEICGQSRARIREITGVDLPAYYEILYAHVQSLQGEYLDSYAIADAGMKKAAETNNLVVYLSSLSSKALALMHMGRWGELQQVLQHAIELSTKNGNDIWVGIFSAMRAWLHMQCMDFRGAQQYAQDLLRVHTEQPAGQTQTMALLTAAYCELTDAPEQALRKFQAVCNRVLLPGFFMQWYWTMIGEFGFVGALLGSGRLDEAKAAAHQFLDHASRTADPAMRSPAWDALARVADAQGDHQRACEYSDRAMEEARDFDLPSVQWRVHSTAARLWARMGDSERARDHIRKAKTAFFQAAESFGQENPLRRCLADAAAELESQLERELTAQAGASNIA